MIIRIFVFEPIAPSPMMWEVAFTAGVYEKYEHFFKAATRSNLDVFNMS